MAALRVLGIDPGSRKLGYGLVDSEGSRLRHVDNGVIVLSPKAPLAERLATIHERLTEVIDSYRPDVASFEKIFFSKNARSALVLGHARGVAMLAAAQKAMPIHEYTPSEIKQAVSASGRADKTQVAMMVKFILGLPEPAQEDASDALAAAICHCSHGGT